MLLTGGCLFGLFASVGNAPQETTVLFALGVALAAAAAYAWLALSIRCPGCRRRVGFLVLTQMHASQWLVQLWNGESCPVCGDRGNR